MRPWTWFWVGRSVNALAVEVTIFTIPVIATIVIGASPTQVATIVAIELVAGLVGPLLLAGILDSRPTRGILVTTDVARAVLVALIPAGAVSIGLSVPLLAGVAFLLGLLRFTGMSSVFVATPRLVPDLALERANSQLEGGRRIAGSAGPLLAGLLVVVVGAIWAPAVEALLLLATAAALMMIPRLPPADDGRRRLNGIAAIGQGLRAIYASPALTAVTITAGAFNAMVAGALVLVPLLVLRDLAVTPLAFGIGSAVGAVGGIAGAAVAPRILARAGGPPVVMPAALLVAGLSAVPLIAWHGHGWSAAAVYALTQFVNLGATTTFVVTNSVIRQRRTPAAMLGRTTSAYMFLTRGIAPGGAALFGWLADATTLRTSFALVVAVQVAAGASLFLRSETLRSPAPTTSNHHL